MYLCKASAYSHFCREVPELPWEATKAEALRADAGL